VRTGSAGSIGNPIDDGRGQRRRGDIAEDAAETADGVRSGAQMTASGMADVLVGVGERAQGEGRAAQLMAEIPVICRPMSSAGM
jgi:hypothetical protein